MEEKKKIAYIEDDEENKVENSLSIEDVPIVLKEITGALGKDIKISAALELWKSRKYEFGEKTQEFFQALNMYYAFSKEVTELKHKVQAVDNFLLNIAPKNLPKDVDTKNLSGAARDVVSEQLWQTAKEYFTIEKLTGAEKRYEAESKKELEEKLSEKQNEHERLKERNKELEEELVKHGKNRFSKEEIEKKQKKIERNNEKIKELKIEINENVLMIKNNTKEISTKNKSEEILTDLFTLLELYVKESIKKILPIIKEDNKLREIEKQTKTKHALFKQEKRKLWQRDNIWIPSKRRIELQLSFCTANNDLNNLIKHAFLDSNGNIGFQLSTALNELLEIVFMNPETTTKAYNNLHASFMKKSNDETLEFKKAKDALQSLVKEYRNNYFENNVGVRPLLITDLYLKEPWMIKEKEYLTREIKNQKIKINGEEKIETVIEQAELKEYKIGCKLNYIFELPEKFQLLLSVIIVFIEIFIKKVYSAFQDKRAMRYSFFGSAGIPGHGIEKRKKIDNLYIPQDQEEKQREIWKDKENKVLDAILSKKEADYNNLKKILTEHGCLVNLRKLKENIIKMVLSNQYTIERVLKLANEKQKELKEEEIYRIKSKKALIKEIIIIIDKKEIEEGEKEWEKIHNLHKEKRKAIAEKIEDKIDARRFAQEGREEKEKNKKSKWRILKMAAEL